MKGWMVFVLTGIMALALVACNSGSNDNQAPANGNAATQEDTQANGSADDDGDGSATGKLKVGVSMPTKSLQRWNQDGYYLKSQLETAGYEVDLQYAGDNEVPLQVIQLEDMISRGCDVLVIAAVNGLQICPPLEQAKEKNIPVIAYDRLIMNSEAVTYYTSFDNYKIGQNQGRFIVDSLNLGTEKGPFNIELFTGDPNDSNVAFLFDGAMDVLKPYIEKGVLVVKSGQTEKSQCVIEGWNTEKAQARMENLISSQGYSPSGTKLDAVMSSNDSIAQGITNALVNARYTEGNFPILTGQDCDVASIKNMLNGLQTMSIFKDTRYLAERTVRIVDSILKGETPEINNDKDYNNGTGIIPSYLCAPVICTKDNYKELLIDSGYYKEYELE